MKTQNKINEDQNAINEQTKVAISIRTFYGILVIAISATTVYLYNAFSTASDIKEIKVSVNYIKEGLETHLTQSEEARKDMRTVADQRNERFAAIDTQIALIKSYIRIQ